MDFPLIFLGGWMEPPAHLKPDCSLPLVVWKVGIPGNATASGLVWGLLGGATRCSRLLTTDISESSMKWDVTTEQTCRVLKSGIELFYKRLKNYHGEKGHFRHVLII